MPQGQGPVGVLQVFRRPESRAGLGVHGCSVGGRSAPGKVRTRFARSSSSCLPASPQGQTTEGSRREADPGPSLFSRFPSSWRLEGGRGLGFGTELAETQAFQAGGIYRLPSAPEASSPDCSRSKFLQRTFRPAHLLFKSPLGRERPSCLLALCLRYV